MFQWNIRIAAILIVSAAMATTAAAQPQKQGGKPSGAPAARAAPAAPAARAAPAPHPAPAPHVAAAPRPAPAAPRAAPHIAAPRAAPHAAAPHVSAQRAAPQTQRATPRQVARPSGPPASATARHAPTPRTAAPAQQQPQTTGRNVSGQGGPKVAQPSPRGNLARQAPAGGPAAAVGAGAAAAGAAAAAQAAHGGRNAAQQQNATQPNQLSRTAPAAARAASNARAFSGGVLRNQAFANLSAARDPGARALAGSTFQGRFFDPQWRRHRPFPVVIGWVGPLFWPYAYNDFVDYTFYPYAYDTFWPYAYDDFYDGMFGAYAEGYGGTYAAVGPPNGYDGGYARGRQGRGGAAVRGVAGGRSVGADLCSGQTAGLTDWPIERIAQTVEPNDAQRAVLDELKAATAQALDILKAACPMALPSTPTGRIEAMHQRLDAMLEAVRTVRPVIEKFYQSLNDEQKARFNALGPDNSDQQQAQRNLTQVCGERASGIASLPLERIERAVQPDGAQRSALKQLQDATSEAVNLLNSDCPTYRALTPVVRLQAMEQRLDAMLRAVQTVEPALEKFYGSLGDEQKERFNRLSPSQG
jgi:LTXXQ motif family protein